MKEEFDRALNELTRGKVLEPDLIPNEILQAMDGPTDLAGYGSLNG